MRNSLLLGAALTLGVVTASHAQTPTMPPAAGNPPVTTAAPDSTKIGSLIGLSIHNRANDKIGEVEDVIVGADGRVQQVVASVGGFLGLGAKHVAIAWNQVRMDSTRDVAIVDMTKEQLSAAPEFKERRRAMVAPPAGNVALVPAPVAPRPAIPAAAPPPPPMPAMNPPVTTAANPPIPTAAGNPPVTTATPEAIKLSSLIGLDIHNRANDKIGEVSDVVVGADGRVQQVVASVGGFLGMGAKQVAIAWNQVRIDPIRDVAIVDMTKEQLTAAPEFKEQRRMTMAPPAGAVARDPVPVAPRPAVPAAAPPAPLPPANPPMTTAANPPVPTAGNPPVSPMAPNATKVSSLIGLNIHNRANDKIGEVDDVVVGADGRVQQVVVSVGGFLGLGSKQVAIAWDQFRMDPTRDVAMVDMTKEQLTAAPEFKDRRRVTPAMPTGNTTIPPATTTPR